jgi:NADH dehydrogenase
MTSDADTILFPRKTAGEKAAKPIVVVVGCGFGGLQAAHHLVRYDIEVVLIDRTNHHLFQPLLYQVSMAALSPADIASPIRALLGTKPNVSVILGEVEGVDKDKKLVVVKDTGSIPYDYLILATGSAYAWFGHDEWADHAAVLKTLPDALQIRRRILEAFDWAESRTDPDEVRALTSFVVIGGGPTGVELVGSLAELARSTLKSEYRHIDPAHARIVLVDAAPRILGEFPERLSNYAAKALRDLGVELKLNAPCESIDGRGVTLKGGERIEAANVFWCAGTKAEPAGQWIGAAVARNNAVEVTSDCSVPGHPEIFAIGDVSSYKTAEGKTLPALAPVAKQEGAYVAKVIGSRIGARKHPGPFKYNDLGTMAVIGRSHAIAVLLGVKLTGRVAWLAWSLVHLLLLIGFRNRIIVFTNWAWAFVTYGRGSRLVVGKPRKLVEDDHLASPERTLHKQHTAIAE